MSKWINPVFLALALFGLAVPAQAGSQENGEEKVVYHFNDSSVARAGLNNIRNHLEATGDKVKIVVVAHGPGIDFLLEGAQDKNGNPYDINVEDLGGKGVEFRVCNNTLKSRQIDPRQVLPNARIVPSGVAEIGRLQSREGYAYLKP